MVSSLDPIALTIFEGPIGFLEHTLNGDIPAIHLSDSAEFKPKGKNKACPHKGEKRQDNFMSTRKFSKKQDTHNNYGDQ